MKTRDQFLLGLLAEECNEVAQECSKCDRFGLDEQIGAEKPPNRERLQNEVQDLFAVLTLLAEEYGFDFTPDDVKIQIKRKKIAYYYNYTKSLGRAQ